MAGKKKELFIVITGLLLVFLVGWLVYSYIYRNSTIQKEHLVSEEKKGENNLEDVPSKKEKKNIVQAAETVYKTGREKEIKAPKKLTVSYSESGAVISWKKVKDAEGYVLFRRNGQGKLKELAQTKENSYIDETVKKNRAYRYRICVLMKEGEEVFSGQLTEGAAYFHAEIDPDKPMVALTFDDGPSIYTPEILKTLKKYHARATFFIVGERVSSYSKTIKQASKLGCEIGSHSYSHANLGIASRAVIKEQLDRTEKKVKKVLGYYTPVMRPPFGSIGTQLREYVGKPMILWSIDTLDWKTRDAKSTENKIMSTVQDGDIILMHDLYSQSRDAAKKVIPKLIKKGYQLVTVSEMAQYKKFKMEDGKAYTDMRNVKKK